MLQTQDKIEPDVPRKDEELQARLEEAEEILRALRGGEVDALVISGPHGEQVYSLKGAEHPYRMMVEVMNEGAVTLTSDGTVFYSNRSFAAMLKLPLEELIGSTIRRFVLAEDLPAYETLMHQGQEGSSKGEIRLMAGDGSVAPVYFSVRSLGSGATGSVCVVATDLSEHKRNQELMASQALERARLAEAEAGRRRITSILESITDSFLAIDRDWRIADVNQRAAAIYGRKREELVGKIFWDEFPQCRMTELADRFHKAMSQRIAIHCEASSRIAEGHRFEIHAYPTGEGISVYFRDITERKQAEQDREHLLRRIALTQEDERRRIAREMHDEFGQHLIALTLKLAALKEDCREQTEVCEQIKGLQAIAQQLDAEVDFLVRELRPIALDDLGLLVALNNYVNSWSNRFCIHVQLHTSGMEKGRLTSELETVLYRVMQEALTNVAKHAKAGNVAILLECRSGHVSLIVEDDGVGFDVEYAFRSGHEGMGLIGMRERAALAGGMMEVESHPGAGATILVRIPIPPVSNGESQDD